MSRLPERDSALSRRSARTLYNVADALIPDAARADVAPGVERRIRWAGVGTARATWLLLRALEWHPVLTLREPRGFSWLPRPDRQALLSRWQRSPLFPGRRTLTRLHTWIEDSLTEAAPPTHPSHATPKDRHKEPRDQAMRPKGASDLPEVGS